MTRERATSTGPSPNESRQARTRKESTRKALAEFLRVTPEEIVITRNTSESNNLVSSGLDLKPGDEVLLLRDNHPSNLTAWQEKAKRFGYTVVTWSRRIRIRGRILRRRVHQSHDAADPVLGFTHSRARSAICCRPRSCAASRASAAS